MSSISLGATDFFHATVGLLNQPIIKEGVKNIAGSVTFVFGLVEIYDIYQIARGREISTEVSPNSARWVQTVNKVVIVCAKVSLILSACVSRPGVYIISSLAGTVFSTVQLNRVFGPNTIFAVNPWHPRHVVSIAAVILALPAVVQATYRGVHWAYRNICEYQDTPGDEPAAQHWLTDAKIRLMAVFNTIASRPALHIGNQLGQFIMRRA